MTQQEHDAQDGSDESSRRSARAQYEAAKAAGDYDYTPEPRIYRIIRFRQGSKPRTIRNNVTLSEAQAHCSREDTHGPGWFDGYDYMRGCRPEGE